MVNLVLISKYAKNRKYQCVTPLILAILVLPTFIAIAAPVYNDPLSELSDLMLDTQPIIDSTVDEGAIIEKAEALLKSQFTENRGQVRNDEVLFYGQIPNGMIGFGVSKIFVWLGNTTSCIVMSFDGANAIIPKQNKVTAHQSNYFLGDRGTFTGVSSSEIILYENLWDGIDLEYRATPHGTKYEFHIAPGAYPEDITVNVSGHDMLSIGETSLQIQNDGISFTDDGLVSFQEDLVVKTSFNQLSSTQYGFNVDNYDQSKPLIIDPLIYSTYVGGNNADVATCIAIDSGSNVYVAGITGSSNFPASETVSPYYDNICFVFKLNSTGNGLLYSTFVGGSDNQEVFGIDIDDTGNAYVTGWTESNDFPTINAYDDTFNGWDGYVDGFVFKLNSTGNGLAYSTYIGGETDDNNLEDIRVDSAGNAYVVGWTGGTDFPLVNAFDATPPGAMKTVLFKLNTTGNGLVFSTYFGGTGGEMVESVDLDSSGNIYISGQTYSDDLPLVNPFDSHLNGSSDCFVAKFNSTGTGLEYSTYIGGNGYEGDCEIYVDSMGYAYGAVPSASDGFPTVNAFDSTFTSGGAVFKLSISGSVLEYSTFLRYCSPRCIQVDSIGNAYVAGFTNSYDFPVTNAFDQNLNGTWDCFIAKIIPDGSLLAYATYIGGSGSEEDLIGLAIDTQGFAYLTGRTQSPDFPIANAYNGTYSGNTDCFVLKLADNSDSDGDSLSNYYEDLYGTDKFDNDSDDDNLDDGDEILTYYTDPLNYSSPGWIDGLDYGTYFGGEDDDWAVRMVLLPGDVVIVLVNSYSESFPMLNPYDSVTNGHDCAIFKLNLTSNQLLYSTYVGGSSSEYPNGLVVDSSGNAYIVGQTLSVDFPIIGGFSSTFGGSSDIFVIKLNSTGNGVLYSTYIGGSGLERVPSAVLDDLGNLYLSGVTGSSDFEYNYTLGPSTNGIFVMKINPSGDGYDYCSMVGNGAETHEIIINSLNEVIVVGRSWWSTFPTVNAYDNTFGGGDDIILFKVNPSGNTLMFSTFIGGTSSDWGYGIDLDNDDNIYITGSTASDDFPLVNALDDTQNGAYDCFIMKFNPTASVLNFSTYMGGASDDYGKSIKVAANLDVYIGGRTKSSDFPVKAPFDGIYNGGEDLFVAKINSTATGLLYSTYLGGSGNEYPRDLRIDSNGIVYLLADTPSSIMPTPNGYDATINGVRNSFIFVLNDNSDSDGDQIIDRHEDLIGTDKFDFDSDNDELSDGFEYYTFGTSPLNNDTDSDLMPDGWEYDYGLDPTLDDSTDDLDDDLLSNYLEYTLGCNPANSDTDSDTLLDGDEYFTHGTNPASSDSDSDLMPDNWELDNDLDPMLDDAYDDYDLDLLINLFELGNGTLANNNDTDFDKMPDGWEVESGLNATIDDANDDLDLDTLTNLGEYQNGTLASFWDSDFDDLSDGAEVLIHYTNPLSPHSDSDSMPDGWEVSHGLDPLIDDSLGDPDTDLLLNEDEYIWDTDPQNPDSDFDTFLDGEEVHNLGTDPTNPLSPIITREPEFSTFIGGSSDDTLYDAIVDSLGNIYLTGQIYSTNFPIVGAYDSTHNGNWDTMIVKLNSTGNGIIFSTFIGGSSAERGLELYIDSDFSVWLTGYTTSSNFPVYNAYDSTYNGGWDGFIVHLSADGSSLLYSTYIGGSSDDLAEFIIFDDEGNLYLSGFTRSSNFPVANGYDMTFNGDRDAFALKMQSDLQGLVYSTFIGGTGYDYTYGSRLAANGDFIISGVTTSTNFPVLNEYDSSYNGGDDIFVTRLNATGNGLVFSTYIGGSGEEYFGKFDLDEDENLLMGGSTVSTNFPTLNAYDDSNNGGRDAFALKLASNGSVLYFSTYIGGSGSDTVYGVQVDQWNNIHLSGVTSSIDIPIKNSFQNESQGGDDTFVFKINSTGNGLLYSTYLGGSSNDGQRGMAIDSSGWVYIVGWTQSSDHPIFNAYDETINGGSDGFVTCLAPLDDIDSDGLPDEVEISIGSNPFSNDTDLDLMLDGWEYFHLLNVTGDDAAGDADSDGLSNLDEFLYLTDPNNNDTDSDSLLDGVEVHVYGSNPNNVDSDSDTLDDGSEVNVWGTSPTSTDTDSDTMPDSWEVYNGLNATLDDSLGDLDGDDLLNLDEYLNLCDPQNPDSDADKLEDGDEVQVYHTDPLLADTDADTISDWAELVYYGSDPLNASEPAYDVTPIFSTYLGGSGGENAYGIDIDQYGYLYITGYSTSIDFPIVGGLSIGSSNIVIVKMTPDADAIIYSTYFGGNDLDISEDIGVDSSGRVWITGRTESDDLPVLHAIQTTFMDGTDDGFVLSLSPEGNDILFCSYLGGSDRDTGTAVAVDPGGYAYIVGRTLSNNFPTFNSNTTRKGNWDGFIVRISPANEVLVSRYFGGTYDDSINGITIGPNGHTFITGYTFSSDFPVKDGYDMTISSQDAFAVELASDAQSVVYGTFIGGSYLEYGYDIAVDLAGSISITGMTYSNDFPCVNAIDSTFNGDTDVFVTKLSPNRTSLDFSTYVGGSDYDRGYCIAMDNYGNVYLSGNTQSPDFPLYQEYDSSLDSTDAFITKFTPFGGLLFSSFIGGGSYDGICSVDIGPDNRPVFLGHATYSWPLVNAFDSTMQNGELVIIKLPHIGDRDGDGIIDPTEISIGSHPLQMDTDSDGMNDGWEFIYGLNLTADDSLGDPDFDSLTNLQEYTYGTNPLSNDTDLDLLPDAWEVLYSLNPLYNDAGFDLDLDGLTNFEEYMIGTLVNNSDTDSDGCFDGWEVTYLFNPLTFDSGEDSDTDDLTNLEEFTYGTNPRNSDSDSDLMSDGWEVEHGLNPLVDDAQSDLDSDGLKNIDEFGLNSNPANSDSDSDDMPDLWEFNNGLNLIVNDALGDLDSDGLSNLGEYENHCDPNNGDTDDDDLGDLEEIEIYGTSPLWRDTDRDILDDGYEIFTLGTNPLLIDTDNDTLGDGFEALQYGTDPTRYDTDSDGMSDGEEYLAGTNPLVADADADEDGDGLSNIEEWNAGTDIFDADTDNDGISDFDELSSGRDPLLYELPFPIDEILIFGVLIVASIIPAFAVFLMNEKKYRKASRVRKNRDESSHDSEEEGN